MIYYVKDKNGNIIAVCSREEDAYAIADDQNLVDDDMCYVEEGDE